MTQKLLSASGEPILQAGFRTKAKLCDADAWRHVNIGRLLNNAVRRFEGRLLEIMIDRGYANTRLTLFSLTKNLDVEGTKLTELARRAAMTKQAMGELVDECEALNLVRRVRDPNDGRARIIMFTQAGRLWLGCFHAAVEQAEREMRTEFGEHQLEMLIVGLEAYGAGYDALSKG
jgi:DNA-binding MarR family transcriptional regulator